MAKIYDSIMSLIKPARIATGAATLDETAPKVTKAVDAILPSLLAKLLKKGNTPEIAAIFKEAARVKQYDDYDEIWKGSGIDTHKNIGERLENQLLGTENPKFYHAIATHAGIKTEHADRLTNWVAGTIAGFIGHKVGGGKSYKDILVELEEDKAELRKDVPADIITMLGLGSLLGVHNTNAHKPTAHQPAPKKKSMAWLWWLLGLLLLAAIIFFVCRSCDRKKAGEAAEKARIEAAAATAAADAERAKAEAEAAKFPKPIQRVLPNGQIVNVYQGDYESYMDYWLSSDKFKNATDAELMTVWFEFSDMEYEHNSATEFMAGGEKRIQRIAAILKKHPNVKLKIGAFADKTGTRGINYSISEARAKHVRQVFVNSGIPAGNIAVEGYGEEYAKVPANASDAARAIDRDVAMRFTK